jgi:glucan 1,3-beta-glucosidase
MLWLGCADAAEYQRRYRVSNFIKNVAFKESYHANMKSRFGPTMCGEWSQADTDCTQYLNNVNIGSRWEGSMNFAPGSTNSILKPSCPGGQSCECNDANADPSKYSDTYKQWLLMFAEAQMASFEKSWGWFYWSWDTETATQWSWKKGVAAGILPTKAYQRSFNCTEVVPDYAALGLPETY